MQTLKFTRVTKKATASCQSHSLVSLSRLTVHKSVVITMMNPWHMASLALLLIAWCVPDVHGWSQGSRNQILKIHNDYRNAVKGACNMKTMTYDMHLENEAKAWAERCEFRHKSESGGGGGNVPGENIAWQTLGDPEPKLLKILSAMWHGEVKDFTYGQKSCGNACHYTQLVWAETNKVGCYGHPCSDLSGGGPNAYFLVCFYSPAGNMDGEDPYKTKCGSGGDHHNNHHNNHNNNNNHNGNSNEHNNNHGNNPPASSSDDGWGPWESGADSDNGWADWESDDSWRKRRSADECVDKDEYCDAFQASGLCESHKAMMKELCRETCDLCT